MASPATVHAVEAAVNSILRESTMVLKRNGTCTVVTYEPGIGEPAFRRRVSLAGTFPATRSPRARSTRVLTSHWPFGQMLVDSSLRILQSACLCSAWVIWTGVPPMSVAACAGFFVASGFTVSTTDGVAGLEFAAGAGAGWPVGGFAC